MIYLRNSFFFMSGVKANWPKFQDIWLFFLTSQGFLVFDNSAFKIAPVLGWPRMSRRVPRPPTTLQTDLSPGGRWQFLSSASLQSSASLTFSTWHCVFVRSWVIEIPFHTLLFFNPFALNKTSAFSSGFFSLTINGRHFPISLPVRKYWVSSTLTPAPRLLRSAFNWWRSFCSSSG